MNSIYSNLKNQRAKERNVRMAYTIGIGESNNAIFRQVSLRTVALQSILLDSSMVPIFP